MTEWMRVWVCDTKVVTLKAKKTEGMNLRAWKNLWVGEHTQVWELWIKWQEVER